MTKKAFSLIECMVTLVLLMIAIGAVVSFRGYTVLAAQRAEDKILAAHTAQLLSEAWRSEQGDPSFDAAGRSSGSELEIAADEESGQVAAGLFPGGNYAGSYRVQLNEKPFQAHLFYQDYSGVVNVRSIHVIVTWHDSHGHDSLFHLPTLTVTE